MRDKIGSRAEKRTLRERMLTLGFGYRDIAAELGRQHGSRPRTAWREAYGWTLKEASGRINAHSGKAGLGRGPVSSLTAAHLCEYEKWPRRDAKVPGRRPTPYILALLAGLYRCAVPELIDLADREHLPSADLLVMDTYQSDSPALTGEPASPPTLNAWPKQKLTGYGAYLRAIAQAASGPEHGIEAVLDVYAGLLHDMAMRHNGPGRPAMMNRDAHLHELDRQTADLVEALLADGAAAGTIRNDVTSAELAAFCLCALDAAIVAPSKDAVSKLVRVTLAGLRSSG